ncbi:thioesterase II family protein, partial [Enterococcus faecium]|uniref:thioesterase II family protein n=1 Tax=Enterococcus faecium TaxID=1352 RepID=UPI003F424603
FEVARRLEADGVTPLHVIVSAHAAPEAAPPLRTMSEAPDDELMAEIAALGLLPPDAFASDELRSLVLAPTRADFRLSERYVAVAGTQIAA